MKKTLMIALAFVLFLSVFAGITYAELSDKEKEEINQKVKMKLFFGASASNGRKFIATLMDIIITGSMDNGPWYNYNKPSGKEGEQNTFESLTKKLTPEQLKELCDKNREYWDAWIDGEIRAVGDKIEEEFKDASEDNNEDKMKYIDAVLGRLMKEADKVKDMLEEFCKKTTSSNKEKVRTITKVIKKAVDAANRANDKSHPNPLKVTTIPVLESPLGQTLTPAEKEEVKFKAAVDILIESSEQNKKTLSEEDKRKIDEANKKIKEAEEEEKKIEEEEKELNASNAAQARKAEAEAELKKIAEEEKKGDTDPVKAAARKVRKAAAEVKKAAAEAEIKRLKEEESAGKGPVTRAVAKNPELEGPTDNETKENIKKDLEKRKAAAKKKKEEAQKEKDKVLGKSQTSIVTECNTLMEVLNCKFFENLFKYETDMDRQRRVTAKFNELLESEVCGAKIKAKLKDCANNTNVTNAILFNLRKCNHNLAKTLKLLKDKGLLNDKEMKKKIEDTIKKIIARYNTGINKKNLSKKLYFMNATGLINATDSAAIGVIKFYQTDVIDKIKLIIQEKKKNLSAIKVNITRLKEQIKAATTAQAKAEQAKNNNKDKSKEKELEDARKKAEDKVKELEAEKTRLEEERKRLERELEESERLRKEAEQGQMDASVELIEGIEEIKQGTLISTPTAQEYNCVPEGAYCAAATASINIATGNNLILCSLNMCYFHESGRADLERIEGEGAVEFFRENQENIYGEVILDEFGQRAFIINQNAVSSLENSWQVQIFDEEVVAYAVNNEANSPVGGDIVQGQTIITCKDGSTCAAPCCPEHGYPKVE